ncbi:type IV fimbrial biogenesis protein FimT/type IV fimbrial biogenesis protein FimU [Halospina denitrificans]|uniref:Type II secretion system protein H n=1 Tax=Halospina denitrificans TaxID=332522 RepID=A0A4R7JH30_9GAMM|nr:GspH/FimT family pseudopilin [Halospina denitrificans]TDT37121.1 type IV fimbrial biogenesis protein FimT/type IV fimbrial biogenesis protein FimU [Halospina denitrificans]
MTLNAAPSNSRKQSGFTLIELMIVVILVAIIATVAIPGYQQFVESNEVSAVTNRLVGTLSYARSEALKEGRNVTVNAGADDNWDTGFEVEFGGDVLRSVETSGGRMNITGSDVTFRGNGLTTANVTFQICGDNSDFGSQVQVTQGGQVTSEEFDCS